MFVKSTLKMCITEHKVLTQLHFVFFIPLIHSYLKGTLPIEKKLFSLDSNNQTFDDLFHNNIIHLSFVDQKPPMGVHRQAVKTQMKCCIMQHFIRVCTVC